MAAVATTALKQLVPMALLLVVVVVAAAELAAQDADKRCGCSGGLCCSKYGLEAVDANTRVGTRGSQDESKREIDAFFDHVTHAHETGCKCVLRVALMPPNLFNVTFTL